MRTRLLGGGQGYVGEQYEGPTCRNHELTRLIYGQQTRPDLSGGVWRRGQDEPDQELLKELRDNVEPGRERTDEEQAARRAGRTRRSRTISPERLGGGIALPGNQSDSRPSARAQPARALGHPAPPPAALRRP